MNKSAQSKRKSPVKGRPESPLKQHQATIQSTIDDMQEENQTLQFSLGERDVEIERLKTTLVALNEKLVVTNDIKDQLDEFTESYNKSEVKRGELQVHMVKTSETI